MQKGVVQGNGERAAVDDSSGGGGGLQSPKPEKIAVKLRKIAENCSKIAVKIVVHFFLIPRLYASH